MSSTDGLHRPRCSEPAEDLQMRREREMRRESKRTKQEQSREQAPRRRRGWQEKEHSKRGYKNKRKKRDGDCFWEASRQPPIPVFHVAPTEKLELVCAKAKRLFHDSHAPCCQGAAWCDLEYLREGRSSSFGPCLSCSSSSF